MNNIRKFIEKAIEGGWKKGWRFDHCDSVFVYMQKIDATCKQPIVSWMLERVFLDPFAWQAVGKVEGWEKADGVGGKYADPIEKIPYWKHNMHRMMDALAEGKSLEEFIKTL